LGRVTAEEVARTELLRSSESDFRRRPTTCAISSIASVFPWIPWWIPCREASWQSSLGFPRARRVTGRRARGALFRRSTACPQTIYWIRVREKTEFRAEE